MVLGVVRHLSIWILNISKIQMGGTYSEIRTEKQYRLEDQSCACCRYFCHLDFVHERARSNPNKEKGQKGSTKERLVMIS